MTYTQRKDALLSMIREGSKMNGREQLVLAALLSVPSILAQLSHIVMMYIDAAMVGSLGASASASIGLVSTTIWLFGGVNSSANVGFNVLVAHRIGAKQWTEARNILRQSFITCISFSLLLTAIGLGISRQLPYWLGGNEEIVHDAFIYFFFFCLCIPFQQLNSLSCGMLRSSGDMKTPSIMNIIMCIMDILLNWILIFPSHELCGIVIPGANLGILGAVIGTGLSYVITSVILCYILTVRNKDLNLLQDKGRFLPEMSILRKSIRISMPIGIEHAVLCGAQIMSTVIVAPLGTIAIAANSFGITIEALCYMPGYGIADAATTLVGQSLGAGRNRLARSFGSITIGMGIIIMTIMGVAMYATAPFLMSLMTPDVDVQELATRCLRIEAFAEPMFAASIVCYGVFIGAGDTIIPCTMNLMSIWVVRITLAFILASSWGLAGVWIAMALELTFRGIIFLVRFMNPGWWTNKKTCT